MGRPQRHASKIQVEGYEAHQIRNEPSSQPVTSMQLARAFHERTFTSASCAFTRSAGFGLRVSQMAMCPAATDWLLLTSPQCARRVRADTTVACTAHSITLTHAQQKRAPSTPQEANTPASLGLH